MFGSENVLHERLTILGDPVGTPNPFFLMRAPRNMTVLAAYMVCENTQNAGTAVSLALENWGTAGTAIKASGGTVVQPRGGTAAAAILTSHVPAAGTVVAANAYVAEGEWLVVNYLEEGTGWISGDIFTYDVSYVLGSA